MFSHLHSNKHKNGANKKRLYIIIIGQEGYKNTVCVYINRTTERRIFIIKSEQTYTQSQTFIFCMCVICIVYTKFFQRYFADVL